MTIIIVMPIRKRSYPLVYAPDVKDHLRTIERTRTYYSLIRKTIESQLRFEPAVETKNRKPLKRSTEFQGDWELRFGPDNRFRVFYEVDDQLMEVNVLAIGFKFGSRLVVGGEEVLS
jgi:hypothetical protein